MRAPIHFFKASQSELSDYLDCYFYDMNEKKKCESRALNASSWLRRNAPPSKMPFKEIILCLAVISLLIFLSHFENPNIFFHRISPSSEI